MSNGRITVAGARFFGKQMFGRASEPLEFYYLALVRQSEPTVFNTADELDEVSIGEEIGYFRQPIPNTGGWWAETASLNRTNAQDVIYDPAVTDWGLIKYWALCNQPTGGDVFFYGALSAPVDINPLDRAIVPVGQVSIAFNVLYQGD